ncbi:hypothetical protein DNTS_001415 [Danionella cerebrum]|uniref:Fibronectin type-III domain-containing protein n=1 Tax=Danionella cerebrum TaxID=2873325 RepID=A0A553R473_9TELE|nr:hypothetical protein DNTS_001415 [Danionella translucida]
MLLCFEKSEEELNLRRQNMKVRINATGDTIVLKFVRPNPDIKLEGYILGYGSSMFSKQFIQLPENGEPYETEIDAEPKYLVAVQPMADNDVKKHCTGKVNLEKPLHLVIDSVSPTSVLLSWGTYLKTPYEGNIMNECLAEGHYTVRYRERNRKWIYQTCSTSDTVIDNLKPNTPYEFGVRPNKDDRNGMWSKPVIHKTNMGDKNDILNKPPINTMGGPPSNPFLSAPPMGQQGTVAAPKANEPKWPVLPLDSDSHVRNESSQLVETTHILPQVLPTNSSQPSATPTPYSLPSSTRTSPHGHLQNKAPSASQIPHSSSGKSGRGGSISSLPPKLVDSVLTVKNKNQTSLGRNPFSSSNGMRPFPSRRYGGSPAARPQIPKKPNLVGKPGGLDKTMDQSQDKDSIIQKPKILVMTKPSKPKATSAPTVAAPRFETWENSSSFSSVPASKVDAMGKDRYIAPHVVYKTDKKPDEPCSITTSLSYFPQAEGAEQNVTNRPKSPPSNLTIVTVEGCPSFVILDWQKTDNETTEYEVISTTKGPEGEQVSILTTNQTHTAVENLKPESSYVFKVKPKNELGEGPSSEPVSFNTESADPRVSENVSGKDAIWTQFPFKTDSYSECNGKQYVKRTWYRKFVGVQICNSLRYKIYLSDSLNGKFYNIGDQTGHGEDHCQFVDSFLDGRTGTQLPANQLPNRPGFYRAMRQEPVNFGQIGGNSHINYVAWYECGTPIPGKW